MTKSVALALLLLAGCDDMQKRSDTTDLALRSGTQSAEIEHLKTELNEIKAEQNRQSAYLQVTAELAQATSAAHESLRDSFSKGAQWDNDQAHRTYLIEQNLDRRLSRYDGQRITSD
jgi:hypothetical protein